MKRKILKRIGLIACMITLLTTILMTSVGALYTELNKVPDLNRYTFKWHTGISRNMFVGGAFDRTKVLEFSRPYSAALPNYVVFGNSYDKSVFGDHTERIIECEDFSVYVTTTGHPNTNAKDVKIEFECDGFLVADYNLFWQGGGGDWLLVHQYRRGDDGSPEVYYTYEANGIYMNLSGTYLDDNATLNGLTLEDLTRRCITVYSSIQHMVMAELPMENFFVTFDKKYSLTYPGAEAYGEKQGYKEGRNDGYDEGYSDGEIYGVGIGHEAGYTEGYTKGNEDGYFEGYDVGYDEGEGVGWHNGFSKGQTDALESTDTLKDTIFSIFEAPVTLINGFLDFEILGINLAGFVKAILTLGVTALIVTFILKLIKG